MKNKQLAIMISGASGGIGSSLCEAFRNRGFFVIATDKIKKDCCYDEFIEMDLISYVNDHSTHQNFNNLINNILVDKPLVGLINNAAVQILDHLKDLKIEDFQKSIDINVKAPLLLTKDLISYLKKSKGTIINIGSIHSDLTKENFLSYAVSKSALKGLTQSLSIDLGPFEVTANLIQPAATRTTMLESGFKENKEALEQLEAFHPLGRIASPEEISKIALFLVENRESFINGAVIQVDGGISNRLHDPD